MEVCKPLIITPRLEAGIKIGKSDFVSIAFSDRPGSEGRTRYRYWIDTGEWEHTDDDVQSGCQGGTLKEGLGSLLAFLSGAAESFRYAGKDGENANLFPERVVQWAIANQDELDSVREEIENKD